MTRSPSLVIAVACALAVCVAGTAAAVGAAPASAPAAPSPPKTLPGPTDPFPTASVATTSTSTTVAVTLAGSTIPPGTVQLTDTTRRIRVNVPNTWTDTSTSPGISDDGGDRPTVSASVDVTEFRNGWTVPGVWMTAVDPSLEPDALLGNNQYSDSCRDGGVESFANAHFAGLQQRWSDCGGGTTQLLVVSGRPPDGSATVLLQLQTLSPDDPAVNLVLDSFSLVPGSKPPAAVDPTQPPTVGDVPPSLLHTTAPPDAQRVEDSGHHLAVMVPADWTAKDVEARTNDDYSNRPFLLVGPDLDAYQHFVGAGLVMQQLPYRDPSIPLTLLGYDGTCTDAGVQTFRTARLTGYVQTWTACDGTNTRAIVLAASPADHSSTVVLEVHLPDADNTPLALALSTLELE